MRCVWIAAYVVFIIKKRGCLIRAHTRRMYSLTQRLYAQRAFLCFWSNIFNSPSPNIYIRQRPLKLSGCILFILSMNSRSPLFSVRTFSLFEIVAEFGPKREKRSSRANHVFGYIYSFSIFFKDLICGKHHTHLKKKHTICLYSVNNLYFKHLYFVHCQPHHLLVYV